MIDLSYTNKDGLNLYEGFDNGFDYHRDGKQDGDGYAHGGYPEITGETSNYTDTSYKTGDNVDFFDNGNVWEQPSVNPGPGPEPGLLYLDCGNKKPFYATDVMNSAVTTAIEYVTSKVYSITFENTKYENLVYHEIASESAGGPVGYIGNSCLAPVPTVDENDSDLPFCLIILPEGKLALSAESIGEYTITIEDSELNSEEKTFEIESLTEGVSGLFFAISGIFNYEEFSLGQLYLSGADIKMTFKYGDYSQTNNIVALGEGEEIAMLLTDNIDMTTQEVTGNAAYMLSAGNIFMAGFGNIMLKFSEFAKKKERLTVEIEYSEKEGE